MLLQLLNHDSDNHRSRGKERNMKHNDQNQPQYSGYPQPNGYAQNAYPAGAPYQGYQAPQGYNQQGYGQSQSYPVNQGYNQPQGFTQPQGLNASRSYQTPQVTGSQPAAGSRDQSSAYAGQQGTYSQNIYPQQGVAQVPGGYPGSSYAPAGGYQQAGQYQQPGVSGANGYGYPAGQTPAGSYIPQTPYSQGYTSPGYQMGAYSQGYNAYNQMGRSPQMQVNPLQEMGGQVPLNGGGYIPQPVPVRKKPFVLTDAYLLIVSAVLLGLFAIGMFVTGFSAVKWAFLILVAATTAALWIKPMTESNKRLCYTIVFGLLALITVIGFVTAGAGNRQADPRQTNTDPVNTAVSGQADAGQDVVRAQQVTTTPSVTNTPEPNADYEVIQRLRTFFEYWALNRQDDMLTICSPSWKSKEENPKNSLFTLLRNRTPKEYKEENISGTSNDTSRTVTVTALMDRNNGKDPVKYRMNIMMERESDGLWYVDPKSLLSYEDADTPDPSITNTPAPTDEPVVYPDTILYSNPGKGEYYHLDPNCKSVAEKYLPLQGHFKYSQINDEPYKKLKPHAVCGAPLRP